MGEVSHRTAWYNKVQHRNKSRILWLPFYTVVVDGVGPNFFEPVDCFKRRSMDASDTSTCSIMAQKEINELRELWWGRQAGMSDETLGSSDITLHSFDWDWPKK